MKSNRPRASFIGAGIFATGCGCAGSHGGDRRSSHPLAVPDGGLVAFQLRWCFTCLAPVAGDAGADHILPDMLATPVAGDDMVKGKLMGLLATVLAGILVAVEDLKAG